MRLVSTAVYQVYLIQLLRTVHTSFAEIFVLVHELVVVTGAYVRCVRVVAVVVVRSVHAC